MPKRTIVIGGGISGLAATAVLLDSGFEVTLLEANDQLGGLGTFFQYGDRWVDRFYHCIMPTDDHLLGLIRKVGLEDQVYWKPTTMGFVVAGEHFSFNTAIDLLQFHPISFRNRVRLGIMSLLLRHLGKGQDLDNIRTETFLKKYFGETIWDSVWEPLFRSKFGPHAPDLPALYLWQRLGREKNVSTRGYLRCGLKGLIDAIADDITERGGEIRTSAPVSSIGETSDGTLVTLENGETLASDWVLSTVPMPLLRSLTKGSSLEGTYRDAGLRTQGVVNALFFLSRPLAGHYWTPVVNCGTGFDGVVEMSALVDTQQYGGDHLVYLMKYCDRDSETFRRNDEEIKAQWTTELLGLYKGLAFRREHIRDVKLFKAPFVEPVYPLGYAQQKPDFRAGSSRLILATTAQVYPNITSWNSSTRLAQQAVNHLISAEKGWAEQAVSEAEDLRRAVRVIAKPTVDVAT